MGLFDFLKTKKQQPVDNFLKLSKRDTLRAYSLDHPLRIKVAFLNEYEQKLCKEIFDFCFSPKAVLQEMDFDTSTLLIENEKYQHLKKGDTYVLINKFVKKFGCDCVYCYENSFAQRNKQSLDEESEGKLQQFVEGYSKLKALLSSKGQHFTDTELIRLLWQELREQKCEQFEKKAVGMKSGGVQSYLDVFAELYANEVKDIAEASTGILGTRFFKKIPEKTIAVSMIGHSEVKEIKFDMLPAQLDISDLKDLLIGSQKMVEGLRGEFYPHTSAKNMENFFEQSVIDFCNKISILKKCIEAKGLVFETPNQSPIKVSWLVESSLKKIKGNELKKYEESLLNQDADLLQRIDSMDGYEFEKFLKELFSRMGYEVMHTQLSGDQGADLVVIKHGQKTVVQAKRFSGSVGNGAVQEVVGAIKFYKADKGMVVTNSEYTASARKLALANNVELINGAILSNWIDGNY